MADAWPAAETSPRKAVGTDGRAKDYWVKDCYSAICERAYATMSRRGQSLQPPDEPVFYRSTWSSLVKFKIWVASYSSKFINHTVTAGSGTFDAWIEANKVIAFDPRTYTYTTNYPDKFPYFTNLATLGIAAHVPTNFFTVTFWRDIGGYVGEPDARIQSGYTRADYGFDGLRRILTNLYCIDGEVGIASQPGVVNYWGGIGDVEQSNTSTECSERMAAAKSEALGSGKFTETNQSWAGFFSIIDPVAEVAAWEAGQVKYQLVYPVINNTNPTLYKIAQLYTTVGGPHTFSEQVVILPLQNMNVSAHSYGESGFLSWGPVDCTNYEAGFSSKNYDYGNPITYIKLSGLKYP